MWIPSFCQSAFWCRRWILLIGWRLGSRHVFAHLWLGVDHWSFREGGVFRMKKLSKKSPKILFTKIRTTPPRILMVNPLALISSTCTDSCSVAVCFVGQQGLVWSSYMFDVNGAEGQTLSVSAVRGGDYSSDISIDDLKLTQQECCPSKQFLFHKKIEDRYTPWLSALKLKQYCRDPPLACVFLKRMY